MKSSPEILNELKGISPLLADMEKTNVFYVPEGYFNDLHFRIANYAMLNDTLEMEVEETNLPQVPVGYFDALSDQILSKIKSIYLESAEEELRNLSPMLYAIKGENIFSVPSGYFESLPGEVFKKVKSVYPENAEEELRNLSPMLYALKGKNVFTVPKGYFESFAEDVVEKMKPQPAKIVSMKSGRLWWKYAAAAIVTGAIAITSLQIFNSSHDKNTITASLPDNVKASFQYKTEEQIDAGIAKLSDDEIVKYLENNGNVMDNELLTNNTDVSEMPSQSDYLTDENTLNTYLDKIDVETKTN